MTADFTVNADGNPAIDRAATISPRVVPIEAARSCVPVVMKEVEARMCG
jgi:hypothetical protein